MLELPKLNSDLKTGPQGESFANSKYRPLEFDADFVSISGDMMKLYAKIVFTTYSVTNFIIIAKL